MGRRVRGPETMYGPGRQGTVTYTVTRFESEPEPEPEAKPKPKPISDKSALGRCAAASSLPRRALCPRRRPCPSACSWAYSYSCSHSCSRVCSCSWL